MKRNKSSEEWTLFIKDILSAIDKIERYTANLTLAQFRKNEVLIDAVIRNLEIIGEASSHIPSFIRNAHPEIPWRQIISLRNFLIHEYFYVELSIVWQTIQIHLPELKQQLMKLYHEHPK